MNFCEQVAEYGSHVPLTSIFVQNFNIDKAVIEGIEFIVLAGIISLATGIPNHGEPGSKSWNCPLMIIRCS